MNTKRIASLAAAGLFALTPTLLAHGGTYRGPGDTVPSNPGGGGGRTPNPGGPTTPGPSGPTTPGPSGPTTPGGAGPTTGGPTGGGGRSNPTTGRGGLHLEDDLSQWQFWWEFNKEPFLNLKKAIRSGDSVTGSLEFHYGRSVKTDVEDILKRTDKDIKDKVLPKLVQKLQETDQRDIVSSCLVALAKIG
jgi:hypothetical protein